MAAWCGRHRSRRSRRAGAALAASLLALLALLQARWAPPAGAAAGDASEPALFKLDPPLLAAARSEDPVTVWVGFRDKGESGIEALAAALAAARAALTPRGLARRLRAGVSPLVDYRDLPLHAPYLEALAERGLAPFGASRWLNQAAVRLPGTRLTELAALPFVARVREVERMARSLDPGGGPGGPRPAPSPFRAAGTAAIDYGRTASPLAQIGLPAVHDSGYAGNGVLICILDEGFNAHDTHEALSGVVLAPGHRRDFVEGDTVVTDYSSPLAFQHGTWVMGLLAGNKPGAYVGAAFGADYALGRTEVASSERQIEMVYWGMGAEWADSLGADIISSSLGYTEFDPPDPSYGYGDMNGRTTVITQAARIAASNGILVVNAVGNQGDQPWHYLVAPADANGDSLIAVGAVDQFGSVASFSSYGPSFDRRIKPDLAARGKDCPVLSATGGASAYETWSGTSFSAPLVAGLAACLMQARPAWRLVDVIRALRETASQAGSPDDRVGYGIPSGVRALCWHVPTGGLPSLPRSIPAAELLGPNPVRADGPPTQVRFAAGGFIPGSNPARVRVHDTAGRAVRDLWSGLLARGQCVTVAWDGRDNERRAAVPGVYFISLQVGGQLTSARVAVLR